MPNKPSISKIILVLWLVFSIPYVVYNLWLFLPSFLMQEAYNQGINVGLYTGRNEGLKNAISQVIAQSKACKPFPVNVGENKATLLNVECLNAPNQPAGEQK